MPPRTILWVAFAIVIVGALAIDLGLGRRRQRKLSLRSAAIWTGVWMSLAGLFAVAIAALLDTDTASLFVQGYIVEQALSVDNMFVFIMIFSYFAVPEEHQPRVLKWGILGVLVFRAPLIIAGAALIARWQWLLYPLALLLLFAVYKILTHGDEQIEPEKNPVLRLARRFFPIVDRFEGSHFFTHDRPAAATGAAEAPAHDRGRLVGTALVVVLIVIESTDVVFALDSIPAIFGITNDFFIVFTSNMFAVLGLRALFFVLSGIMGLFRYLKTGVAGILLFIAAKMLLRRWVDEYISHWVSLAVIGSILFVSIAASVLIKAPPEEKPPEGTPPGPPAEGSLETPAKHGDRS